MGQGGRFDGTGRYQQRDPSPLLWVDTLLASLPLTRYRLEEPVVVALNQRSPSVSPLTLNALDGSASVRLFGSVPGEDPGQLAIQVEGLDLHDLYGLLQRDTLGVAGQVGLDLQIRGTARSPTIQGSAHLGEGRFGEFRAPFIQGVVNYADRRLDANLNLWRTGMRVLEIEGHLPVDLAFEGVEQRQLDGPILGTGPRRQRRPRDPGGADPGGHPGRRPARGRRAGGGHLGHAEPPGDRRGP